MFTCSQKNMTQNCTFIVFFNSLPSNVNPCQVSTTKPAQMLIITSPITAKSHSRGRVAVASTREPEKQPMATV